MVSNGCDADGKCILAGQIGATSVRLSLKRCWAIQSKPGTRNKLGYTQYPLFDELMKKHGYKVVDYYE